MARVKNRTLKLRCDYDTLLMLEGSIEYAKSKATYDVMERRWSCDEYITIPSSAILVIDGRDDDTAGQ